MNKKSLLLIIPVGLALAFLFSLPSCTSNPATTAPQTIVYLPATVTPTPTIGIEWTNTLFNGLCNGGTGQGNMWLAVNGYPESTAGVTLVGPGLGGASYPLTFINTGVIGGRNYANYASAGAFTYTPGQHYVFSTVTSAGTAAVTFTAPGGAVAVDSTGVTISWNVEGNHDSVLVYYFSGAAFPVFESSGISTDVNSPFLIPPVVYSGYGSPATFFVQPKPADYETAPNVSGSALMTDSCGPIEFDK